MAYFSEQSLQRVKTVLDVVPADNGYFSMHLSGSDLRADFGWGEGIEIRCENDRYICIRHLERSTKVEEIPSEEDALQLFIRLAGFGKKRKNHF